MRCRECRKILSEELDGRLGDACRPPLEAHLDSCPACRAERDRLGRVEALVRGIPRPPAPPGLVERVLGRTIQEAESRPAPPVARPAGARSLDLAYRVAVVILLGSINLLLLAPPEPGPAESALRPTESRAPAPAPATLPLVDRVDRYRAFFKTVDILADRPEEARPVLARHADFMRVDEPAEAAVRGDDEVAGFFVESADVVADLREWTALPADQIEAGKVRLVEIRTRARQLVHRGQEVRERLIALHEGVPFAAGPAEFDHYVRGSVQFFSGHYEPAKRWLLRAEEESEEGPLADSARYLLVQCLQRTGDVERAAPFLLALKEKGIISPEEFPEMIEGFEIEAPPGPGERVALSFRRLEGEDDPVRFVRVSLDGRELPVRHGKAIRVFIREIRGSGSGDYLVRPVQVGGERRIQESIHLEGGPEFSVEYVSHD